MSRKRGEPGNAEVGDADGQSRAKPAVARGVKDDSAQDRRPQAVAKRRQHPAHELVQHHRRQRQEELVTLDDEERCQSVSAALERSETKSNRRAENHAVTRRVGADAKREENYQCALDQLLDESHLQVAEQARAVHARSSRRRTQMKSRLRRLLPSAATRATPPGSRRQDPEEKRPRRQAT